MTRRKTRLPVLLAAATLLGLLPAPAEAEAAAVASRQERGSAARSTRARLAVFTAARDAAPATGVPRSPGRASADPECFTDPAGDTRRLSDNIALGDERADILEHCAVYGASLALRVQVAQPTDPRRDVNWRAGTFVGWFLDVDGDGTGEFFVRYGLDVDGRLSAQVNDVTGDPAVAVCDAVATFEGAAHGVAGINASCIGAPVEVGVSPGFFYDTGGNAQEADVVYDIAPDDGGFAGPVVAGERPRGVARLAGATRIETAVRIARAAFPETGTAQAVYLARSDVFADAVAGGVLTDGPILLVPRCGGMPEAVMEEIARVDPEQVIALGGGAAICQENLEEAAAGRLQGRLAGAGRIQTAIRISRRAFPVRSDEVYLARADLFADAVAGGVLTRGPILLVPSCGSLPLEVSNEIARLDPRRVVALGGKAAVCEAVLLQAGSNREVDRIAGRTRIETAAAISGYQFENAFTLYLARADKFPDAVAGGVLTDGPILLVPTCGSLPGVVAAEIVRVDPDRVVALGGEAAICNELLARAASA